MKSYKKSALEKLSDTAIYVVAALAVSAVIHAAITIGTVYAIKLN